MGLLTVIAIGAVGAVVACSGKRSVCEMAEWEKTGLARALDMAEEGTGICSGPRLDASPSTFSWHRGEGKGRTYHSRPGLHQGVWKPLQLPMWTWTWRKRWKKASTSW